MTLPWWKIAQGATDYQLTLELPYGDTAPTLVVESMLSGVSLDLPESLAKTQEQSVPLSLTFNLGDKQLLPVLLNYDNKLKAAILLDTTAKDHLFGTCPDGAGEVAQTQDAGLKLEINRDRLALQDWLGVAVAQGAGDGVRELKIHSDHALWKNTDIGVFDLALKHAGNYWAGTIDSPIAKGTIEIPADFTNPAEADLHGQSGMTGMGRISLDMALLDLSALKQAGGSKEASTSQTISPELMPLLSVTSQKTLWQAVDLGRLSLEAERIPGGMGFNNVELSGENQKLVLSGQLESKRRAIGHAYRRPSGSASRRAAAGPAWHYQGFNRYRAQPLISAWYGAGLRTSSRWPDLKGQVDVNFKNGRILSIEPGFGRILGMLALAQWIKRAQLDFSDIYQEGLTFNSIKGHFNLAGGIASTHDLVVDAVPAKIAISGDTDLVSQTVDHIVDVTPKSADAVPIAGTIMGKVAALVGRSLTGKDQEGFFFGSQYLVKGAWGNAEIIPMHKNDGLLQKTWNGITDFPWLRQQE